jgi:PleD family two-component response regulator
LIRIKYSILFFNHPAHYKSAAAKAELDDQVEKGQPSALSLIPTNNLKILIADDKPIIIKVLYDFLKDIGFQTILQASNRKDDLKQILEVKPDLVILDLEMPKLTGIEVDARCKSEGSATKIILLTLQRKSTFITKRKT